MIGHHVFSDASVELVDEYRGHNRSVCMCKCTFCTGLVHQPKEKYGWFTRLCFVPSFIPVHQQRLFLMNYNIHTLCTTYTLMLMLLFS